MSKAKSMRDLYIELLEDSYDSEHQIVDALPKMAKAAQSQQLKNAFEKHLQETKGQILTLEQVFDLLDMEPDRKTCEATEGLIEEGQDLIDEADDLEPGVLDAGLIAIGQKVEHYEIASYGTLCEIARLLGFSDQQRLLASILKEEKMTDEVLTRIATTVNSVAKAA